MFENFRNAAGNFGQRARNVVSNVADRLGVGSRRRNAASEAASSVTDS